MAVEARHMNLFPPQLITNRDFIIKPQNQQGSIGNIYNTTQQQQQQQMDCCMPLVETLMQQQQQQQEGSGGGGVFPLYHQQQSLQVCDPISAKTSINRADSGLTYNIPVSASPSRKRPRDDNNININSFSHANANANAVAFDSCPALSQKNSKLDDIFSHLHQQQQEIDRFIAQHMEKVRMEVEERRKKQSRMLITAIQESVVKKLKEKEEELQRMGKLNWVLQERVKSLYVENQLWRDLAQTNEATANSLRSNLEQVLAHVTDEQRHVSGASAAAAAAAAAGPLADDAESSCGSSDQGNWRKVVPPTAAQDKAAKAKAKAAAVVGDDGSSGSGNGSGRKCRKCGEKESSVLLLPCRHLCLCTMCGSTLVGTCPVCDSVTNASVHVNMS